MSYGCEMLKQNKFMKNETGSAQSHKQEGRSRLFFFKYHLEIRTTQHKLENTPKLKSRKGDWYDMSLQEHNRWNKKANCTEPKRQHTHWRETRERVVRWDYNVCKQNFAKIDAVS